MNRAVIDSIVVEWVEVPGARRDQNARAAAQELLTRLAREQNPTAVIARRCANCGSSEHGGPVAEGAALSVSYAEGLVIAAAAPAGQIGVDVERGASDDVLHDLAALFHPNPAPTRQEWTQIEAALKASGAGFLHDLSTVDVAEDSVVIGAKRWRTKNLAIPGFTAAIAQAAEPDQS